MSAQHHVVIGLLLVCVLTSERNTGLLSVIFLGQFLLVLSITKRISVRACAEWYMYLHLYTCRGGYLHLVETKGITFVLPAGLSLFQPIKSVDATI